MVGAHEGGKSGGDDEGWGSKGGGLRAETEGDESGEKRVKERGGDDADEEVECYSVL